MAVDAIFSFFVNEIYLTLEIRILWYDTFVLLADYMPDLVTTAFQRQAADLTLH